MGYSPRLSAVCKAYSPKVAETWLLAQLENLNDFCGVKNKMSIPQMVELAKIILVEGYFLKTSELMLFFYRFKTGKYGVFYGVVDPQQIMAGLGQFIRERIEELGYYERIAINKRIEEQKKRESECISYQEFLEMSNGKEVNERG